MVDPILNCIGDVEPSLRSAVAAMIEAKALASAVYRESTLSTNDDAIEDLQSGRLPEGAIPRLYLADQQTAGRGRQGNQWHSDTSALTFSLVVSSINDRLTNLVSIAAGVAVARAIEHECAPIQTGLKWPNDICGQTSGTESTNRIGKLGGILIETVTVPQRRFVIGIGINISTIPDLPMGSRTSPISLGQFSSKTVTRAELLHSIVASMNETLDELESDRGVVISEFRSRCVLSGNDLTLRHGEDEVIGHCLGITDDGALELVIDGRRQQYRSGEVQQVRPV